MELKVRNVHEALPYALRLLQDNGIQRESRNGPVIQAPWPVTTVYYKPCERVIFYPERDANPFFHLYESLWMLMGRNDVTPLLRYAKNMANFSDDGTTLHAPYGYRWRKRSGDQLIKIAKRLREDPVDRRSVLQIWDSWLDLDILTKDTPCNLTVTFQRDDDGKLEMAVFCRSNDIIWGAYGANAVHFSMLQEYMAHWIGCPVGRYYQISVNWHAYLNTLGKVKGLAEISSPSLYYTGEVISIAMGLDGDHDRLDDLIETLVDDADEGFPAGDGPDPDNEPWSTTVYYVLRAHSLYKRYDAKDALEFLAGAPIQKADWVVAARQWLERRVK